MEKDYSTMDKGLPKSKDLSKISKQKKKDLDNKKDGKESAKMKIKEIHVEAAFTKSLPNYQNFKPVAGVTITIEPGDDVDKVYEKAWEIVGDEIEKQLKLFKDSK